MASTATVTIGCKLPHGLILELIGEGNALRPAPPGKRYTLKGANSLRSDKRVAQEKYPVAFTEIPEDFWAAWYERNKDMDFIRNGLVFKSEANKPADHKAQSKERLDVKTGMEPLGQKGDERLKKGGARDVETDEEHLAAVKSAST